MLWVPCVNALVLKLAVVPLTVPVPNVVAPSLNVTVPVGLVPLAIVAVNVTFEPKATDKLLLLNVVVVAAKIIWVMAVDVLLALLVSPPYTAVMLWLPTANALVAKLAVVPAMVPEPRTVVPSLNVTEPVGVMPPESVAVKVMLVPTPGATLLLATTTVVVT